VKYYLADREIETVTATEAENSPAATRLEDDMITLSGTRLTRNGKNFIGEGY